jgi:histone demethylase JARID1
LLFGSTKEDVRALAETTLYGKENLKYLNCRDVCGKDGVLTNIVKTKIMMEKERLDRLSNHLKMMKIDNDFNSVAERKCFTCFYDLDLSGVCCECSRDSYSCLRRFKLFCLCEMNKRFVLFRYSMNDISTMVETLDGEQHAINTRATRNNGVVSSKAEDACIDEQDTERTQTFTFAGIIENGWFKERQTILQVHPTSRNKTTKVMLLFVEEFCLL